MNVQINGECRQVADDCRVSELLHELGLTRQRLAVEVNRQLVPRSQFDSTKLTAGDKIEIVTLVGGG
jgi:sulfur carrier protein